MANKPGEANFFPDVPTYPEMGTFQPIYGKFDLTTYVQGASDYEIMAFLVGKYNACLEAYGTVTKLSTETIQAAHQLQNWINTWFTNLDVQQELNNKIDSMVQDGSFGTLLHQTFDEQINNQTTSAVTAWLVANVTPTGSAVVVDKSLSIEGAAADAKATGDNTFSALTIANRKPFSTSLPYNLIQLADLTFGVNLYTALEQNIFRTYPEANTAITGVIPVSDKSIHIYDKRGAKSVTLFEYDYTGKLLKHSDSLVDYTLLSDTSYIRLSIASVNSVNDVITNGTSACYGNYSSNFANSTESLQIANCYLGAYKPTSLNIQRGFITNNTFYENEMYMSARVPVAPGTKVKVTCFLRGASLLPVAEFLDYNDNVIGTTPKTTVDTIYCCEEVTIPAGCSAIVVNSYRDNTTPLQVLTNYQSVTEKIGYTGDSICYGLGYAGGYAGIIDKQLGITSNNIGVSGGHIAKDRTDVFIISDSISQLDNDISMLIMEGGINDYSNYVNIGAITNDYTAELDQTTFYGGLEKLMRDANNRFPEIPKAFIIVHKVNLSCVQNPNDVHPNNVTFENYIDAIYACCRKYSIDVIDINKNSGFNTYLPNVARKYTFKDAQHPTGDGLHPNIAGYSKWYVPAIVNWIEQRQGTTNSILLT